MSTEKREMIKGQNRLKRVRKEVRDVKIIFNLFIYILLFLEVNLKSFSDTKRYEHNEGRKAGKEDRLELLDQVRSQNNVQNVLYKV